MRAAGSSILILAVAMAGLLTAGCARPNATVATREEVHVEATSPAPMALPDQVVQHESSTTVVREPEPERGFLSSVVHVAGKVLALPFRLVGGLLEVIF